MKQKKLLGILIFTFMVTVAWIGFSLYGNAVNTTISPTLRLQVQPITPSFDLTTLSRLEAREKVTPVSQQSPASTTSATPTPILPVSQQAASQDDFEEEEVAEDTEEALEPTGTFQEDTENL